MLANGPYNVLLLTIDSLRADMPWAGYERPIAPRLSALHARSVSYENGYSTSSFTSKSIPGMLTGRYPSELARTGSFFTRYVSPDQFVCKHLAAEGIPCVGGHAHMYFAPGQSGFETGFAAWKIVPGITFDYQTDPYVTSDKLTPLAIEMLKDVSAPADGGGRPFFAWFHYMDPHDQYKSHEESPHFGKRARDLYDEEVFYTDLWIGKLLDFVEAQPWAKKTAIVVTADHGEAFGEHGIYRHAHEVWEELVHVPFFFYVPGGTPRTIAATRGHADLAPTIVELLGAKNVPALPGTSLVKELAGAEPEERDVIVDLPEDDYNERRRALIHGRKKSDRVRQRRSVRAVRPRGRPAGGQRPHREGSRARRRHAPSLQGGEQADRGGPSARRHPEEGREEGEVTQRSGGTELEGGAPRGGGEPTSSSGKPGRRSPVAAGGSRGACSVRDRPG